jgi:hypothetical protein
LEKTLPGKKAAKLRHPGGKIVRPGIDKQDQIVARSKAGPQMPVGLPPKPSGPVPFYRVTEFTGKGKGDPVAGQGVS